MEHSLRLYNKAKASYQTNYYRISFLKELLSQEIGSDEKKLLAFKANNYRMSDYSQSSYIIAVITLIATLLSIIADGDNSWQLPLIIGVYLVVVMILAVTTILFSDRHKVILMVLEEIEKEMDATKSEKRSIYNKKMELVIYCDSDYER